MNSTQVKVLIPRLMSGQKENDIINLGNVENEPKTFWLFGGQYEKLEEETLIEKENKLKTFWQSNEYHNLSIEIDGDNCSMNSGGEDYDFVKTGNPLTLDTEPKWVDLIEEFFRLIETGTLEQRIFAKKEINRMAEICDNVRRIQKLKNKMEV